MATAQTLIDRSLRLIGALASGESPTTAESNDALITLNGLVSAWLSDKDMTVTTLVAYATLATSQSLGEGYENALVYNLAVIIAPEYEKPPNQEIDRLAAEFVAKIRRADASTIVAGTGTNVITKALRLAGALRISEAPTTKQLEYGLSTLNDMIGTWLANKDMTVNTLIAYASAATVQSLPSGYENALVYNLAVELAAQYEKPASPDVLTVAKESLSVIRRDAASTIVAGTGTNIITKALQMIGALRLSEAPTTKELEYGLSILNDLIGTWLANKDMTVTTLVAYASAATVQSLPSGYENALVSNLAVKLAPKYGSQASPDVMALAKEELSLIRRAEASTIVAGTGTNVITKALRLVGALQLSEAPTTKQLEYGLSTLNDMIGTWLANRDMGIVTLVAYASAATVQSLPSGYENALVYNLAVELAPQYGAPASPDVLSTAASSLTYIRRAAAPSIAQTAQKIVNKALRMIGHLRPDEISTATESAYALDSLNTMISSWQTEKLVVYAFVDTAFTLSASDGSYTVGPAGNFALTPRPTKIEKCFVRASNIDYPVELVDFAKWMSIPDKTSESDIPIYAYYEPTLTTGTLLLWPIPNAAHSLHIITWTTMGEFSALSTAISLPPGYERALTYNLAIEIASDYGKEPSDSVAEIARESKATIKRMNTRPILAQTELGYLLQGTKSDIYSGGYVA